ncbi:MAG: hypothetical protein AB7F65_03680 [Dehalococcoidia bacterium]
MTTEPATQWTAANGPIRALRAPIGSSGATIDLLVWVEGRELVVKELASLVRPSRGERRLPIDSIRHAELLTCSEEHQLVLRSDDLVLRLQGPQGVVLSLAQELEVVGHFERGEVTHARPGFVGRVVGWLHGQ